MIFTYFDLHFRIKDPPIPWGPQLSRLRRLVESIWLRLPKAVPKRIRTRSFGKLNVMVHERDDGDKPFCSVLGVADAVVIEPGVRRIGGMSDAEVDAIVISLCRRGLQMAAKHDDLIAERLDELLALVDTCTAPYDRLLQTRSHRSRRWRAELVLRTSPDETALEALVVDSRSGVELERHRLVQLPAATLLYLSDEPQRALAWDDDALLVIDSKGREVHRIRPALPQAAPKPRRQKRPGRSATDG